MSGIGLYEEPFILHEGGHPLTPRIEESAPEVTTIQQWPQRIIAETTKYFQDKGVSFDFVTIEMVSEYLESINQQAGPQSLGYIKWILDRKYDVKDGEA